MSRNKRAPSVLYSDFLLAMQEGDLQKMNDIFNEAKARKIKLNIDNEVGVSLLHQGVKTGKTYVIKFLLTKFKIKVDIKDDWGSTPLYYALRDGKIKIAKYLLQSGAKTNIVNYHGNTPLDMVLAQREMGRIDMVKLLGEFGVDISNLANNHVVDLFCIGAYYGEVEGLKFLIEKYGADVNGASSKGSHISRAIINNQRNTVKFLLGCGAKFESLEGVNTRSVKLILPLLQEFTTSYGKVINDFLKSEIKKVTKLPKELVGLIVGYDVKEDKQILERQNLSEDKIVKNSSKEKDNLKKISKKIVRDFSKVREYFMQNVGFILESGGKDKLKESLIKNGFSIRFVDDNLESKGGKEMKLEKKEPHTSIDVCESMNLITKSNICTVS